MFNNVGHKIKIIAAVFCIIGIIASIAGGIYLISQGSKYGSYYSYRSITENLTFLGILVMVLGSFVSWLLTLGLYGYGELIEQSKENALSTEVIVNILVAKTGRRVKQNSFQASYQPASPVAQSFIQQQSRQNTSPIPVPNFLAGFSGTTNGGNTATATQINGWMIRCNKCGTEQSSSNQTCEGCGAVFQ